MKKTVRRRILADLDTTDHLFHPLVPNAKTVHDRLGLEIARGCTRGCRFCQAGMIYRPVRERSVKQILEMAANGINNSGFEEIALLSLSTGDYSCLNELLPEIMNRYAEKYVSVSMPSMRVGTLSQEVMDQIKRVRKTGFTIAPEAGSERLRQVINKGITAEDLLTTCHDAFSLGWNTIKLYFMIGLPTEEVEDTEAIGKLSAMTLEMGKGTAGRSKQVTISVGTYVPKPHTPFQWERQISIEESREKISRIRKSMPRRGAKLKYNDPESSFLEGVFSRGDRRLSRVIEYCWQKGARFDSWSDHFNLARWQEAAQDCKIDLDQYLRQRSESEILPWHHLESGVSNDFLLEERRKSMEKKYTPDCRYHGCQRCGLCDFTTLQPVVHTPANVTSTAAQISPAEVNDKELHFKYMVNYTRRGDISYLGHLEILQLLFRALRRAGITTHFSKGFNPSPKISFGSALPVGMESDAEYFIMDLPQILNSTRQTTQDLNNALPDGLRIASIELHSGQIPQSVLSTYAIHLQRPILPDEKKAIQLYTGAEHFPVSRMRKKKEKTLDIRKLIDIEEQSDHTLIMRVRSTAGIPGIKVSEALSAILATDDLSEVLLRKISWEALL